MRHGAGKRLYLGELQLLVVRLIYISDKHCFQMLIKAISLL